MLNGLRQQSKALRQQMEALAPTLLHVAADVVGPLGGVREALKEVV